MPTTAISSDPWEIEAEQGDYLRVVGPPDAVGSREVIALVDGVHRAANAALICVAPDLRTHILAGDLPAAQAALAAAGVA